MPCTWNSHFELVSHTSCLRCLRCPFSFLSAQPETTADSQLLLWRHQPNEQLWWPLSHPHLYRSKRCVGVLSLMHAQVLVSFIASFTHSLVNYLQIISQGVLCFLFIFSFVKISCVCGYTMLIMVTLSPVTCCRCGGPVVLAGGPACSGRDGEDPPLTRPLLSSPEQERYCQILQCSGWTHLYTGHTSTGDQCSLSYSTQIAYLWKQVLPN